MENNHKALHILRWVYLAFAILLNGFIIMHSCLPGNISEKWSGVFVSFFVNMFNNGNSDTSKVIDVKDVSLSLDSKINYQYNYLEGYLDNEIGIGNTKRYQIGVAPNNATNKAIKYSCSDISIFDVNQVGDYLYVTALKEGNADIVITSEGNNTLSKSLNVNAVLKRAPKTYTYQKEIEIYQGGVIDLKLTTGDHSIDECYDFKKLHITPSSRAISRFLDSYYTCNIVGEYSFNIEGNEIPLHVLDNKDVIYPKFLEMKINEEIISGKEALIDVTFENEPTSRKLYYEVSDTSLASINQESGVLYIKPNIKEEKIITITAYSSLDPNYKISKDIKIKPLNITDFELVLDYYGTHINDQTLLGEITQTLKIWYFDNDYRIYDEGIKVTNSNEEVAHVYIQGHSIYIVCLKEGKSHIEVSPINNLEVSHFIDLEVSIKGVINYENYHSFSEFIRKSIGHFLLFLVSGIFTFLTFYAFLIDKKKYLIIIPPIVIGVISATISEIIQHFIPTRFGSVIDVLTDIGGFLLGMLIVALIIYLIKHHKKKKLERDKNV